MVDIELINTQSMPEKDIFELLHRAIIVDNQIDYVGKILAYAARLYPDANALITHERTITYHHLYYYAILFSKRLQGQGIKPRDRVLLLFENSIEFYIAYFGIIQIGAVVAPLNTFLHERELAHIIKDAAPKLLVCSVERAEKLKEFATELPPILDEHAIEMNEEPPDKLPEFSITSLPFEEMVALLYTSGTTGFPKGVMLSSKNILTNVLQVVARFGITKQQRIIAILPLFHSLAQNVCVWSSLLMGCSVIVAPKIDRRSLLRALEELPTIFVGVPALFGVLCLLKTAPLDSISYFFSGGDALPDKIRAAFELLYRRKICNGYGVTEASPAVSVDMEDVAEPTSNAGKPLYGIKVEIRAKDDTVLAPNTIGMIWLKSDTIMLGYYNAPEITRDAFKDDWFCTGDLGYLDNNGKLVITGREKDLLIHKGLNIYPQEIENIILLHPNVLAVGVVGLEDEDVGQVPIAYVQLRKDDSDAEQKIRELCVKNLAAYKVPRQYICSAEVLPTTATGKVDKKVLRQWVQEIGKKDQ